MTIKKNAVFSLKKYGNAEQKFMIRLRVSYHGYRLDMATGFYLKGKADSNGILLSVDESTRRSLQRQLEEVDSAFEYFENKGIIPTPQELKNRISGTTSKQSAGVSLFETFDIFLQEGKIVNSWTNGTLYKFYSLKKDLLCFDKDLSFEDLSEEKLTSFVTFLKDEHGLNNSTIQKKIDYLRWFLNWANNRGFNKLSCYKSFRTALKKTRNKVIFLTKEELDQLRSFKIPQNNRHLEKVRDVFLFCCFSGLRHSDVYNLRRIDIKDNHFEITTVKTADSLSIELNYMTRAILDKYKDQAIKNGKALPVIGNQAMNRDLKVLCRMAGINRLERITTYRGNRRIDIVKEKWELVGTHTGRRTFIVNALSLGISPSIVMKWTGHSEYKSMKPYIDIVDNIKAREMNKFDYLLENP